MSFAINQRLNRGSMVYQVVLVHSRDSPLSAHGAAAQKLVRRKLEEKGVTLILGMRATNAIESKQAHRKVLILEDHTDDAAKRKDKTDEEIEHSTLNLPYDQCIWVTGGKAPAWIKGVKTSKSLDVIDPNNGDLLLNTYMQSVVYDNVFGGGDCATIQGHRRAKAGVFAVMAGMALSKNLKAWVVEREHKRLMDSSGGAAPAAAAAKTKSDDEYFMHSAKFGWEEYIPQTEFMGIINVGDGTAIASRGKDL